MIKLNFTFAILCSVIIAIVSYYLQNEFIFNCAKIVSDIFLNFLKLISLPLVFFSITATISGLKDSIEVKDLTKRVLFYTLITTFIAAIVALILYLFINPAKKNIVGEHLDNLVLNNNDYFTYLLSIFPSNFIKVFLDNNIIGCVLLAFLIGGASLSLSIEKKEILNQLFAAIFDTLLAIARLILKFLPIAIWAFITVFLYEIKKDYEISHMMWYFLCIILANFIQAFIVLPFILRLKGVPVIYTVKSMMPALVIAFFSKSSSATLPTTMQCAQEKLKIPPKLSSFVLPICTTINMNACAAFIFITVMFVSEMNGYTFSLGEMLIWVFLAVGAAVGNAGVPMGCYFMATTYLISLKVPLHIMGVILPFYTILDMFETSINVWSDSCIAQIIYKEYHKEL